MVVAERWADDCDLDLGAQKVVKGGGLRACVDALRDVNPDTIEYACNALSNMTFPGALDTGAQWSEELRVACLRRINMSDRARCRGGMQWADPGGWSEGADPHRPSVCRH